MHEIANSLTIISTLKLYTLPQPKSFTMLNFLAGWKFREEKVLHIRRQTSLYGTLQEAFGRELCNGLEEVDFAQGKLRLSGFLSKTFSHASSKVAFWTLTNLLQVSQTIELIKVLLNHLTLAHAKFLSCRLSNIYVSLNATNFLWCHLTLV